MFLTKPIASAVPLILFLSLFCGTESLLVVTPLNQVRFAPGEAYINCHFNSLCTDPIWTGPALNDTSRSSISRHYRSLVLTISDLQEEDEGTYTCSCNGNSAISRLTVNHYPNVDDVERNQTFFRGSTASIECNSYPGQPEMPLIWVKDWNLVATDPSSRVRQNGDRVVIEDISEDDSGLYKCGYIAAIGFISADIMVNVVDSD